MKKLFGTAGLLLCVCLSLLLVSGCGKKEADYENASSSMKPEGHLLAGGAVKTDNSDEDVTAGDIESLDETGANLLVPDTGSADYHATYGRSTAPLHPVFFDFDSGLINTDQLESLNRSGDYLLDEKKIRIVVEGNCDARGTAEYNIALGELRALNVKRYLFDLGVAENRIKTISYGSERPLYPGSDEASWAMNRRADLVIP